MLATMTHFAEPTHFERLPIVGMMRLGLGRSALLTGSASEKAAFNSVVGEKANIHLTPFLIGVPIGLHVIAPKYNAARTTVHLPAYFRGDAATGAGRSANISRYPSRMVAQVVSALNLVVAVATICMRRLAHGLFASRTGLPCALSRMIRVSLSLVGEHARMTVGLLAVAFAFTAFRAKVSRH